MIDILMAANKNVYTGIEMVIYSTMYHNKNIRWHIFTMNVTLSNNGVENVFAGLSEDDQKKLTKIVKYLDPNSEIAFYDVYRLYDKYLAKGPNVFHPLTPHASLRLLIYMMYYIWIVISE